MRYYEARYPEVDELVMVQVRQIAEMGAYVKLVRSSNFRPIPHGTTATINAREINSARVRQHRRDDPTLGALPSPHPIHPKTNPGRPERGRRSAASRQRKR
jgi:hypothetical protein